MRIAFPGVVLFGLLAKKPWVKKAVQVWSGFLAFSGALPLFMAAPQLSAAALALSVAKLVISGVIFFGSKRYIEVDELADFDWRESMEQRKQAESREGA